MNRRRKGFTLVEILAATAIMIMLMGMVVTMTSGVLTVFNKSTQKLATNMEAREALKQLSTDLEMIELYSDDKIWFDLFWGHERDIGNITLPPPVHIMFYAPVTDRPRVVNKTTNPNEPIFENIYGDICAVSYRIKLGNPFSNELTEEDEFATYSMFRSVLDSEATFLQTMANNIAPFEVWVDPNNMIGEDENGSISVVNVANNSKREDVIPREYAVFKENSLASNIVDFRVQLHGTETIVNPDTGEIVKVDFRFPENMDDSSEVSGKRIGFTQRRMLELTTDDGDNRPDEPGKPSAVRAIDIEYIDVILTVLPAKTMERIRVLAGEEQDGVLQDDQDFVDIVNREGQTFTRRVRLLN